MTDFVVDASVVAKCLLPEPHSDRARAVIRSCHRLRAPDLIVPEVASTLLKRVRRSEVTSIESQENLPRLITSYLGTRVRLIPSGILAEKALRIASTTKRQSINDCLDLALAVQARCLFITADEKFIKAVRDPALQKHLVHLADRTLQT